VTLRQKYLDDARFAAATHAVAQEIAKTLAAPASRGKALRHDLDGWRRSAFADDCGDADLRLIFRPHAGGGIDVRMFGPRYLPDNTSIYHAAKRR
jgi:hypothetical protein